MSGPCCRTRLNWQLIGSRTPLGATRTGTFGGGQTFGQTEERARLRSAILTFMTVDAKGGKVIESGLLADVRVTVDTNTQFAGRDRALEKHGPDRGSDQRVGHHAQRPGADQGLYDHQRRRPRRCPAC